MRSFASGLGLAILLMAGGLVGNGAVMAGDLAAYQRALEESRKDIIAENPAAAIARLDQLLADEEVPGELMALAFFYRGVAHDKRRDPNATLSDMKNALWFNILPQQLQAQALVRQATAYARLGRRDDAVAAVREARRLAPTDEQIRLAAAALEGKLPTPEETASIDPNKSVVTKNQERVPTPSDNPLNGITAAAPMSVATKMTQPDAPADRGGIQLGALPNQQTAEAEWARISRANADLLATLQPRYEQSPGGGGLIRLRAGPVSSYGESEALCAKLRGRGQDCFPVAR
mgnify:CR=1 FL=1